jgi:pimeloyl-ACP methyl ester carboxylesterase
MLPTLLLAVVAAAPPATAFVQVAPDLPLPARSPGTDRAVLLIHGMKPHPVHKDKVERAELHSFQRPDSDLVRRLGRDSDVFAFAYAQTVAVDDVACLPALADAVARLRRLGYREVVLVGHSAGGLVARRFVEDHPDAGVTRVVLVAAPLLGTPVAGWPAVVRSNQREFLGSLGKAERKEEMKRRADVKVPADVEMVCVVANGAVWGDGVVGLRSQWPDDLQKQGVPAYPLFASHRGAVRSGAAADLLARLVKEPQPRWDEKHVAAARRELLGE